VQNHLLGPTTITFIYRTLNRKVNDVHVSIIMVNEHIFLLRD
jgi:hypothetical protein